MSFFVWLINVYVCVIYIYRKKKKTTSDTLNVFEIYKFTLRKKLQAKNTVLIKNWYKQKKASEVNESLSHSQVHMWGYTKGWWLDEKQVQQSVVTRKTESKKEKRSFQTMPLEWEKYTFSKHGTDKWGTGGETDGRGKRSKRVTGGAERERKKKNKVGMTCVHGVA